MKATFKTKFYSLSTFSRLDVHYLRIDMPKKVLRIGSINTKQKDKSGMRQRSLQNVLQVLQVMQ